MITPSAPTATAARDNGATSSRRPPEMAGVDDDREVGQALDHRDGRDVQRVAGRGLEGADAPFAQDDLEVAALGDVFRGHEPLSMVALMPRLSSTGLPTEPSACSSAKLAMLRVPTCSMSA